jgi:5'-nucleotidase
VIGDIFAVLPFGNTVVTRTVTGAQLWAALENGVSQISVVTCDGADGRFPQISGFKFTFKCSNPAGARVLSVSLSDNTPIPADGTTYTFATNNFVNSGGDFYSVLNDGQGVTRDNMFDVTVAYVQGLGTITPTLEARITKVP